MKWPERIHQFAAIRHSIERAVEHIAVVAHRTEFLYELFIGRAAMRSFRMCASRAASLMA